MARIESSYPRLGNGQDYGIVEPPTDAQECLDFLARKILKENLFSIDLISRDQYNTYLTKAILKKLENKLACNRKCPFREVPNNLHVHELDYIQNFENI